MQYKCLNRAENNEFFKLSDKDLSGLEVEWLKGDLDSFKLDRVSQNVIFDHHRYVLGELIITFFLVLENHSEAAYRSLMTCTMQLRIFLIQKYTCSVLLFLYFFCCAPQFHDVFRRAAPTNRSSENLVVSCLF